MEKSAHLLVGNGRLITHDDRQPFLENGCVAIRDGLIVAVGPTAELQAAHPGAQFIDARGRVIMPGLINTHTHLYSAFARGMALKDDAPGNFSQILERLWWRLDKSSHARRRLLERDGGHDRLHPQRRDHDLRSSCQPRRRARQLVPHCQGGASNRPAQLPLLRGLRPRRRRNRAAGHRGESHISSALQGLQATTGCADSSECTRRSRSATRRWIDAARVAADLGAGFHVHTAEAASDAESCLREHGKSIVQRWNRLRHSEGDNSARALRSCRRSRYRGVARDRDQRDPQSPVQHGQCRGLRAGSGDDAPRRSRRPWNRRLHP